MGLEEFAKGFGGVGAEAIEKGYALNAEDGAEGGAGFGGLGFASHVGAGVSGERDAGASALGEAIVDEAVFANVEMAAAGGAVPVVRKAAGEIAKPGIVSGEGENGFGVAGDVVHGFLLGGIERAKLAGVVVNEADGGDEVELLGARGDGDGVFGMSGAGADDGVDVDLEFGVLGEETEFLVEDLEAFLGDFVGLDVVDGNLELIEAGGVEAADAIGGEEIAVGDQDGDAAVMADAGDGEVEIGMEEGFAAGDGDDGGAEGGEGVDTLESRSAVGTGLEKLSNSLQ